MRTPWLSDDEQRAMGLIDESGRPIIDPDREKKTPQQGASIIVFAATGPLLAEIGGVYLKDNEISPLDGASPTIVFSTEPIVSSDVVPHAVDPESPQRLWELSERLLEDQHQRAHHVAASTSLLIGAARACG